MYVVFEKLISLNVSLIHFSEATIKQIKTTQTGRLISKTSKGQLNVIHHSLLSINGGSMGSSSSIYAWRDIAYGGEKKRQRKSILGEAGGARLGLGVWCCIWRGQLPWPSVPA